MPKGKVKVYRVSKEGLGISRDNSNKADEILIGDISPQIKWKKEVNPMICPACRRCIIRLW